MAVSVAIALPTRDEDEGYDEEEDERDEGRDNQRLVNGALEDIIA